VQSAEGVEKITSRPRPLMGAGVCGDRFLGKQRVICSVDAILFRSKLFEPSVSSQPNKPLAACICLRSVGHRSHSWPTSQPYPGERLHAKRSVWIKRAQSRLATLGSYGFPLLEVAIHDNFLNFVGKLARTIQIELQEILPRPFAT